MAQTPEGRVKQKIKQLVLKYKGKYCPTLQRGMGTNGDPDALACIPPPKGYGVFVGIEAKADRTKEPTELQKVRLQEIKDAGGIALVIHKDNLDYLEAVLHAITHGDEVPSEKQFADSKAPGT